MYMCNMIIQYAFAAKLTCKVTEENIEVVKKAFAQFQNSGHSSELPFCMLYILQ